MILRECRFYEWKKDASKKQPYYIHFKDSRPLAFAALYDSWKSSEGQFTDCFFRVLKETAMVVKLEMLVVKYLSNCCLQTFLQG